MPTDPMIAASHFKARCLRLLDEVSEEGIELTITKRGKPVAKLVPVSATRRSQRGAWKGLATIEGDIVHVEWTDDFEATR